MDIIILFFIALIINLSPENNEYLGVESTTGLKGFLALGIIFHHLSQWVTTGIEFQNFSYMGTYIVSIFFFLSGYSLFVQKEKSENYLDGFIQKRMSKILTPFLSISTLYLIYRYFNGEIIDLSFFIDLFKHGSTVIYNGWFINIIILMYIFFYVSFKISKNSSVSIFLNTVFIMVYIILAMKLKYGFWWYNSCLPFIVGLLWGKHKKKIDDFINRYYFIILIILTILLFISHQYDFLLGNFKIEDRYSYTFVANLDNIIFTLYFILLIKKINFSNKYLLFLGGISFELYMIHGLIMSILSRYMISSTINDIIYTSFILIFSVLSAWFINSLLKKIK